MQTRGMGQAINCVSSAWASVKKRNISQFYKVIHDKNGLFRNTFTVVYDDLKTRLLSFFRMQGRLGEELLSHFEDPWSNEN